MKRYGYLSLVAFLFLITALWQGFDITSSKNDESNLKRVEESIVQAAITCYSIEGFYPKEFTYLQQNYHVQLDMKRYQIHYEWIADNIRPDIFIFMKGDK